MRRYWETNLLEVFAQAIDQKRVHNRLTPTNLPEWLLVWERVVVGSDKFFGAQKELRSATCGPKIKWIMGGKRENKYWKISCNTRFGRIHYSSRFDLPRTDKFIRLRGIWRFVSFRSAFIYIFFLFVKTEADAHKNNEIFPKARTSTLH